MNDRRPLSVADLDPLPRVGFIREPSPITPLPALAGELGLASLAVKRDDQITALFGGTKPRKLDHLLAASPWKEARGWTSAGAIGSGHLVALAAAGRELQREVDAHLFNEPMSEGLLENLAYVTTHTAHLSYSKRRVSLALKHPGLLFSRSIDGRAVIPFGASCAPAAVGLVRAALELGEQIRAGTTAAPDRVYVAIGSGGTTAGLAIGLALAGVRTTVHAIATVERRYLPRRKLDRLIEETRQWLVAHGIEAARSVAPVPVVIERAQLGRGYGAPTRRGVAARTVARGQGIELEAVYTAKAFAAILALRASSRSPSEHVLFWMTARAPGALPETEGWEGRLPPALARRIARAKLRGEEGELRDAARRRLLIGGAALIGAASLIGGRTGGYPRAPAGEVLSARELEIFACAAEALVPIRAEGPAPIEIALAIDRYLIGMPPALVGEVHALAVLIEQGTILGGRFRRLSRLSPEGRTEVFTALERRGGLLALAYRGTRDLIMLGYWQHPATWRALGYGGPTITGSEAERRGAFAAYEALRAPHGRAPRGVER